jgi:hypothetical protein
MEISSQAESPIYQMAKIGLKLIQAIDETLEMLFGQKMKPEIYNYLDKRFGLRRGEIVENPETLSTGLFDMFGSASKQIELNIVKRFHNKLGIEFKPRMNFEFADYVREVSNSRGGKVR